VSADGGSTFDTALLRPPAGTLVVGVESARSRPATIYATLRVGPGTHPRVARSDDGGQTWQTFDPEAAVGAFDLAIAAVDPDEPRRAYFRVSGFPDETLAVTEDGGASLQVSARIDHGMLTAFGRRADGTLLVAGIARTGGVVLASADGGATWQPWAQPPHARDFAEREGTLHVVGDDAVDRFAIAVSRAAREDGTGLRPLMRLADVSQVRPCAFAACASACAAEVARNTFRPSVCAAPPAPAADAGATAAVARGRGCSLARGRSHEPALWLLALAGIFSARKGKCGYVSVRAKLRILTALTPGPNVGSCYKLRRRRGSSSPASPSCSSDSAGSSRSCAGAG
jgi:hypothetical protein